MNKKEQFIQYGLGCLGYKSKQDLIENLYLKAIVDSYERIDKIFGIENEIRDRFMHDFHYKSPFLMRWIQDGILKVSWEDWVFKSENELGRTDIGFFISGFGNFNIECKRLKNASQKYIDEGLHRFINQDYSANETYAGMLGFVISGEIENISSGILRKCETEKGIHNTFTKQKYTDWEYSFKTAHPRKDNSAINIYHLFLDFNKNKA